MSISIPQPAAADFQVVPISQLHESHTNPRRTWDPASQQELVNSVKSHGVLQPLLVRRRADEAFEVVAGARRLRAAQAAKLDSVPVIVRQMDDRAVLEVQFIENLQRSDLHPLDEGNGYRKLHEEHGYAVEELATKLGKSRAYVYQRMQLGKLPVKAQTLFFDGKIELGHALMVSRIPVPELADEAASEIAEGDVWNKPMTLREARDHIERNFQLHLSNAPFPTGSKTLLASIGVGACGPCPKRLGNQQNLFGEPTDKHRSNVCTDRTCFQAKVTANWEQAKAAAQAAGGRVLEGSEAKKPRMVDSLDGVTLVGTDYVPWKELVKGQQVQEVLVQGSRGEPVHRFVEADLRRAAQANGHFQERKKGKQVDGSAARAVKDLEAVKQKALPLISAAAARLTPAAFLRMLLRHECYCQRTSASLGVMLCLKDGPGTKGFGAWQDPKVAKKVEAMNRKQLQGLLAEILADDLVEHMAEELGVDLQRLSAAEAAPAEERSKPGKKSKAKASKSKARR